MSGTSRTRTPGSARPGRSSGRSTRTQTLTLLAVVLGLHVVAFGLLLAFVVPAQLHVGAQVFGLGLGVTAYVYGLRHAFDPDHIAAIDNTTRKLVADGQRPVSIGFWFAMGHSTVVAVMAVLVAVGARVVTSLLSDGSETRQTLGLVSTFTSGAFLYLIGILNLIALVGIARVFFSARTGGLNEARLEQLLAQRGLLARILQPLTRAISRPWQMYPIGFLFGLGFDTATEISLLVLAGAGAASGLPWYAVVVLPLLFASGMSLLDFLDGVFMNTAYSWAFTNPIRKVYYNLAITGLSVAVALLIGTIELVGVLHEKIGWTDPVSTAIASVSLDDVGFIVVGLFVVFWVAAIGYWKIGRVEERWTA
jgi:high-affinity nickel-transport protein